MPSVLTPVIRRTVRSGDLRRRHVLPIPGRILVAEGDHVAMGQIWARGRMSVGLIVADLPRILGVQPADVHRQLLVSLAETVEEGTLLAGSSGRMGIGRQWVAPARGILTSVSSRTGVAVFVRDIREVALHCRLAGTVTSVKSCEGIVVEGRGVAIAAAVGAGGRTIGPLMVVESGDRPEDVADGGEILVTPDPLRAEWVYRAAEAGAAAIIAPSADDETLSELALAPTIAGLPMPESSAVTPPVPIVLTEGVDFGRMPQTTQTILRGSVGEVVALVASRQPGESEVVLPPGDSERTIDDLRTNGLPVRIVAGPESGEEGVVIGLAPDVARAASGSPAVCVKVRRVQGGTVAVPVANCEALA
jgi:hypothetical protein